MNKELVNLLVDLLERWDAETFVLRSALREAHGKRTKEDVGLQSNPGISDFDLIFCTQIPEFKTLYVL
jgi:hypothetical protein